jgi:REP element-mobilizing transposase RayT
VVIAHHLIWTAYGWWLPNDPRGSSSHEIRVERIAELGDLHYGRKCVQPRSEELRRFYADARQALKHALLTFTDDDILRIGEAFGRVVRRQGYTCYECAILPDHVHCLIRRHRDRAEQMIAALQEESRAELIAAGSRAPDHPVWGGPGWKRFLNTAEDIWRIVRYIRDNLVKARRPEQHWDFITPYDGWLPAPSIWEQKR